MSFWEPIAGIIEICWRWCAETETTLVMIQASLFVLAIDLIRRRRLWWPSKAVVSCFTNILMMLMNGAFAPIFIILMDYAETSYGLLHLPRLDPSVWSGTPSWMLILLILLASDFADYWNHRLMHASKWFWPIHAIHHSDEHLTVLTTGRVHILEPVIMQLSYLLMLTWLSLPYEVLGGMAGLRILHNMYTHMNLDWDHGPFKYLIASPRYHRWHHADEPAAYGKNLANVFPFYDVLFGTYYVPGKCDAVVGAKGVPTNTLTLVAWPLIEWNRLIRKAYRKFRRSKSSDKVMSQPVAETQTAG